MAEFVEVVRTVKRMCDIYRECDECPLYIKREICEMFFGDVDKFIKAEEIIIRWKKEHPIQTNADKFEEVFGVKCVGIGCNGIHCIKAPCTLPYCDTCALKDFWEQEYKAPTKEVS